MLLETRLNFALIHHDHNNSEHGAVTKLRGNTNCGKLVFMRSYMSVSFALYMNLAPCQLLDISVREVLHS